MTLILLTLGVLVRIFKVLVLDVVAGLGGSGVFRAPGSTAGADMFFRRYVFLPREAGVRGVCTPVSVSLELPG